MASTTSPLPQTPTAALGEHIGARVRVCGLVEAVRDQKRMQFLVLADASGQVQITHEKAGEVDPVAELISALTPGSAVAVTGRVAAAPMVKLGGLEIIADAVELESLAHAPLPIAPDSALERQIDWRAISLRRPDQQLVFRVQTTLEAAMREWWSARGFIEIHSPKLMGTFSESGAEAFKVAYFGDRTAYLAQSPQFYKQMAMAAGLERVFEVGPAFRAEPSFTPRHETEFTSLDMEIAWTADHHELMAMEEAWLAHAIGRVAEVHAAEVRERLGVEIAVPATPFPKVTLAQAQAIVRVSGHTPGKADDLDPEGERRLCAYIARETGSPFVFVTDYPASARAFYHRRHPDSPELTQSFDLLMGGIEITTGAQREHRHDVLRAQAIERGYAPEPLQSYLDFFRYGCPPHGGMGVGLARVLMALLGRSSVRETTLISRTPTRLTP
ncbi:MAG TPA: aspartate--tRNA(Asn) ligase [Caulobacteraceae bacterium]|jgi:aspartyl-tRNA synthetase|nr:aspartate--tRNA(Asn) ligase [Caulobacteraceae bacterium]